MRVYTGGLRTSGGLGGAEGKMQWDSEACASPITIQQLLNHTSGLRYNHNTYVSYCAHMLLVKRSGATLSRWRTDAAMVSTRLVW